MASNIQKIIQRLSKESSFIGVKSLNDLLMLVSFKSGSVEDLLIKEIEKIMKPLITHEPKLKKKMVLAYTREEIEDIIHPICAEQEWPGRPNRSVEEGCPYVAPFPALSAGVCR